MKSLLFPMVIAITTLLGNATANASSVLKLKIDGAIHAGTTGMIESALQTAKNTKAEALLIELDTPGGTLDATRDIVKLFLNSEIPILVFVSPSGAHAGSAGTFITMAGHIAAMAPGTNIGAAHPISVTGSDPEKEGGKHLAQKIENDTVAFVESIAKQRNRNTEWAKKAVVESVSITDDVAVKNKVVDFIAKDDRELLQKADGFPIQLKNVRYTLHTKDAEIVLFKPDAFTQFKNWIADPTIMFVLIAIAGMGFYMEMSHPGAIFPAVASGLAVLLLLFANSMIPLSAIGIGLVILGISLLIMEIYITSFGLLAIGGIAAFVIGALMLFDPAQSDLRVPRGLIAGTALGMATIVIIIGIALSRALGLKQTAGAEGLIGMAGTVQDEIAPGKNGRIFANGEYWNAVSTEHLQKGERVQIEKIENLIAQVRRV